MLGLKHKLATSKRFVLINLIVISNANPFVFFKIVSERFSFCNFLLHWECMGGFLIVDRACPKTQIDYSKWQTIDCSDQSMHVRYGIQTSSFVRQIDLNPRHFIHKQVITKILETLFHTKDIIKWHPKEKRGSQNGKYMNCLCNTLRTLYFYS